MQPMATAIAHMLQMNKTSMIVAKFKQSKYTFNLSLAPALYSFTKTADTTAAYKNAVGEIQIMHSKILSASHWREDDSDRRESLIPPPPPDHTNSVGEN
jgi:hypothetical protein